MRIKRQCETTGTTSHFYVRSLTEPRASNGLWRHLWTPAGLKDGARRLESGARRLKDGARALGKWSGRVKDGARALDKMKRALERCVSGARLCVCAALVHSQDYFICRAPYFKCRAPPSDKRAPRKRAFDQGRQWLAYGTALAQAQLTILHLQRLGNFGNPQMQWAEHANGCGKTSCTGAL